ncbi:MAG TPA: YraN family protein [Herpetosiphonaceae bacterium]|nr:YraN family protein [Herpetosiphonaceae bacterium]
MTDTSPTNQRRALGAWGEDLAARRLEAGGYAIVARGWRCRLGEIDLIATQGAALVFVEVRTRRGAARGSAEESITPAKARRLALLADCYLAERERAGQPWPGPYRIDVIAITLDRAGTVQTFNHIESAIGEG